mgnify:CR=1 FL=1
MMESFFGILKSEMFHGYEKTFKSLNQLEQAIADYIAYYNNKRIKAKLKTKKDNRKWLQPNHTRLPLYIVSFEQCITSLRITNFTITLWPKIDKAVYAVLL